MFPRKYVNVYVRLDGQIPQRYSVLHDLRFEFAASLYADTYREQLGEYAGTSVVDRATIDRFANGIIEIFHN